MVSFRVLQHFAFGGLSIILMVTRIPVFLVFTSFEMLEGHKVF